MEARERRGRGAGRRVSTSVERADGDVEWFAGRLRRADGIDRYPRDRATTTTGDRDGTIGVAVRLGELVVGPLELVRLVGNGLEGERAAAARGRGRERDDH